MSRANVSDMPPEVSSPDDFSSWMADNIQLLGNHPLNAIVIPGSHDTGMYRVADCTSIATFGANACNTQTQTQNMIEQLQSGIRYFDLRPILYQSTFFVGHYQDVEGGLVLGCNGASLSEILGQVATFMQTSKDLVILKFSHYYDRDQGSFGFDDDQMKALCTAITSTLQPVLYDQPADDGTLAEVTIKEYIDGGGKVVAALDSLSPAIQELFAGIYTYADFGDGPGNLVVYDNYSDTNDLDTMISGQFDKLADPSNHSQTNLFLLSWTLTQSTTRVIACGIHLGTSILDLAAQANAVLQPQLKAKTEDGIITPATTPNIIYTDDCSSLATESAIWLNQQILG